MTEAPPSIEFFVIIFCAAFYGNLAAIWVCNQPWQKNLDKMTDKFAKIIERIKDKDGES